MSNQTTLLLNFGELILKGKNRSWFEEKLSANLRANLDKASFKGFEKHQSRFIISFPDRDSAGVALEKLRKVFGIISLSRAALTAPDLSNIEQTALSSLAGSKARTFAVRTKRIDKAVPLRSQELNEKIGGKICSLYGMKVDLDNPGVTVWIDIFNDRAYIYTEKVKGAGGLPTGTGGRVLCLISGGIDSPVAALRTMRRGCIVDFVHFHSAPFTDPASIEKVKELVELLNDRQRGFGRSAFIPFGELQKKIVTGAHEKYRVILYRRFMVRLAEAIANKWGCEALVTGESLGQVASQTLSNLATVDSVAKLPILRPLIGMDKQEIIDSAREFGTFELSIVPHNDCCQFFEPRNPITHSTDTELTEVEKDIDTTLLVQKLIDSGGPVTL